MNATNNKKIVFTGFADREMAHCRRAGGTSYRNIIPRYLLHKAPTTGDFLLDDDPGATNAMLSKIPRKPSPPHMAILVGFT